ncbi:MAG: hypothetical protein U1B78_05625 [Dehalococcoidia bacterium]|nr:hypothetical protein [Dehalococcoidia bacterium]
MELEYKAGGRRALARLLGALVAAAVLSAVLMACGVSFGASEDGTELFKRLTVTGDFRRGSTLSLTLEYAQQYPVEVEVSCVLLQESSGGTATPEPPDSGEPPTPTDVVIPAPQPTPKGKVQDILRETLEANPDGGPVDEATPVPGTLERQFTAPTLPGLYEVACFTPKDDNNEIEQEIVIRA